MSVTAPGVNNLAGLTDGVIDNARWDENGAHFGGIVSCDTVPAIVMDLGAVREVNSIIYYPYWLDGRAYCSQSIAVSATGAFTGEEVVLFSCGTYADCGAETSAGRAAHIEAPIATRYVRLAMSRNTENTGVNFLEATVTYTDGGARCDAEAAC
eukprot:3933893-Rhodomonas_salina.1